MAQQYARLNTPAAGSGINNWLGLDYTHQSKSNHWNSQIQAAFRFYPHNNEAIYSLPEAFTEWTNDRVTITAGRKIIDWAPLEKFWLIGEVNGLRGFNNLEKNQEGLSALHIDYRYKRLRFSAVGSYLHVPQLNPAYSEQNGKITSPNEWALLPPTKARYNGQDIPLYYTLEEPPIDKLLLQPTAGARLAYDWSKSSGVQVFALYKPESIVRVNSTGQYEQSPVDRAAITVRPFINHEMILGTDTYQKMGDVIVRAGILHIDPEKGSDPDFNFTALRIEPTYNTETYMLFSAGINKTLWSINLHTLKLISHDNRVDDLFSKTTKWRSAVGVEASLLPIDAVKLSVDYRQDLKVGDKLLKADASYKITRRMKIAVGAEILDAPQKRSYWSAYRSNDSFYTNLSYGF